MARYVFRGLNQDDIVRLTNGGPGTSIVAKNPNSKTKLRTFIQKGRAKTKFIAMTDSIGVADIKFGGLDTACPNKRDSMIVLVDLDKLPGPIYYDTANAFENPTTSREMALNSTEADNEVVCEKEIPADAFRVIPPLLVDIMTGYEITTYAGGAYKAIDAVCDKIMDGKSNDLIKQLFSGVELNPIEKAFIENYYGLIIGDDGSIKINPQQNNKLIGDMEGVEDYLKKRFHIESPFSTTFLGRSIHTGIINKLNYEKAGIQPLRSYSSPRRDKLSTRNMAKGRYHVNVRDLTRGDTPMEKSFGRSLGGCLLYNDAGKTTFSSTVSVPKSVRYDFTDDGHVAIHIFYSDLRYDNHSQKYAEQGMFEEVFLGSTVKELVLPPDTNLKKFLKVALGDYALTRFELNEATQKRRLAEQAERAQAEKNQRLKEAQQKGELPPEIVESFLRKTFGQEGVRMKSAGDKKGQKEVYLIKDKNFEKFTEETVFDTPLNFKTKTGKSPVQTFNITRIPTRKRTRKGRNGEIIEYYVPEDEKEYGFAGEAPTPYIYYIKVDYKGNGKGAVISNLDSLKAYIGEQVVGLEKAQ